MEGLDNKHFECTVGVEGGKKRPRGQRRTPFISTPDFQILCAGT